MKVKQLLSVHEDHVNVVLTKMATTINPTVSELNQYSNRSCFGRVAHYLKDHNDPSWYIMLFGFRDNGEVTHCCLYDATGKRIVDTFDGTPSNVNGNIVYIDKDNKQHELLQSLTVDDFREMFRV